ncbi:HutD family protein [Pelagibius sp. Alg239-R121]|uniref:HutD/Ves family protein n=1 Tax=Pelagibius sp. Alg239-R121 TaxID=2993448 RepID=UPI0024A6126C|nr:HutD family protein [Pelagibius sp. Alg239-R121]
MKLIRPSDWKTTPWRSGHGETAEIAVFPADTDLAVGDFDWRVSLASMSEDAGFSAFPGFGRILTVVEGKGLELDARPAGTCDRVVPHAPTYFPGERTLTGRLSDGPVKNLNLMFARHRLRGSVRLCESNPAGMTLSGSATALLILSLEETTVQVSDRVEGRRYELGAMDALLQCSTSNSLFELRCAGREPCRFVLIEIAGLNG